MMILEIEKSKISSVLVRDNKKTDGGPRGNHETVAGACRTGLELNSQLLVLDQSRD